MRLSTIPFNCCFRQPCKTTIVEMHRSVANYTDQVLPRLVGSHQGWKQEAQIQVEPLQGLNTKEKQCTIC